MTAALASVFLLVAVAAPAFACTICVALPERTMVDHLILARDVVLAREDPGRPFRFIPVEVLSGSADGPAIPFLVDTKLRRHLAASPGRAVLFARGSTGKWRRLLVVEPSLRPLVEDILARGDDWLRPEGARERFETFAALHDDPDREVRKIALAELDKTPWRLLRTLSPRLPRAELRAGIGRLKDLPWASVRLRLLALDPEPADAALLNAKLDAAAATRSTVHLTPLAVGLVELDRERAIDRLIALYGPGTRRTAEERAAVALALATHGTDGDVSLRAAVLDALDAMLKADPTLGPFIAHTLAAMEVWSRADRLFELLARRTFASPQDGFAVASYVALARAKSVAQATLGAETRASADDGTSMRTTAMLAGGLPIGAAALVSPAFAHEAHGDAGDFESGVLHPLFGWDHAAAMVAVGLLGAVLGPPAIVLLPIVFPLVMAFGGGLGVAGMPLPAVEIAIAASAVVLGVMVAAGRTVPLWAAGVVVAFFAVFHGHAHGTELPATADAVAYGIGFVVGTGLLHLVGIVIGLAWRWDLGKIAVRAMGGTIAVAGVAFLTGTV